MGERSILENAMSLISDACSMNIRRRVLDLEQFDEQLLLGMEDVEMGFRVNRHGLVGGSARCAAAHLAVRSGRISEAGIGYAQVINPLYFTGKGISYKNNNKGSGEKQRPLKMLPVHKRDPESATKRTRKSTSAQNTAIVILGIIAIVLVIGVILASIIFPQNAKDYWLAASPLISA